METGEGVAFPVVSFQTGEDFWVLCDFLNADLR
jgi:hypothetical protein